MNLPSLAKYRNDFVKNGLKLPLNIVPHPETGLLTKLPVPRTDQTGWPWTEETSPSVYADGAGWPKLTIVTPSFQQGQFLEQTIRSVLVQNYPNLEYIVIDGGSNDESKEILEKYSPWISYWQSKPDEGQGQAINLGFSIASGACYSWINSDDYYLSHVFLKISASFLKGDLKFIYGYGYNYYTESNRLELVKILPFVDYFIKIPSLIQPSTFWAAEIHQPIWEELHCSLDFELWLRMVKGNKRLFIREALSVANVHGDAKTVDPKMKAKWHDDHLKIWSEDAHGRVYEWKRINFLNRIRIKIYKLLNMI